MADLFDVLLSPVGDFKPFEYPTFGGNSQIFFQQNQELLDKLEMKTQMTKEQIHENIFSNDMDGLHSIKNSQSSLHNCPKHLIKHIVQCLGYPTVNIMKCPEFISLRQEVRNSIKNLLSILQQCAKGKSKSFSKELLKLIYEQDSEKNQKIKLLQTSSIKRLISSCDPLAIGEAKSILRQFTLQKIEQTRDSYVDYSHISRKSINQRYLTIFISQLRSGKVSWRVSKQDKEWILSP